LRGRRLGRRRRLLLRLRLLLVRPLLRGGR
jgi:hypothetical protein